MSATPRQRQLVLLGAGHTHLHLLRAWQRRPWPGVQLTCISNQPQAAYSGMLTGTLVGQYAPHQMLIDLPRRCAAVGARFILGETQHIDRAARRVQLAGGEVPYDLLSIGIGSRPQQVPGIEHAVSIKPMQTFLARLQSQLAAACASRRDTLRIVVAGGGAGGVEVALCLPAFVARNWPACTPQVTLVHAGEQLLTERSQSAARHALRIFGQRGDRVLLRHTVQHIEQHGVVCQPREEHILQQSAAVHLTADVVVWAVSATAPPLFDQLDLPRDPQGFLLTNVHLQSTGDQAIFVVGDSGTCPERPHPKAGVYAVRQGPVLARNFYRALHVQPLVEWRPQRRVLAIFNSGDGRAIADYWGRAAHARWCWRWKDTIDRRFMRKHQQYD